ncbi:hypothetical protein DJ82_11125 [Halorubrum sp. Ib24]|uniref:DUF4112 domain-containing protein n=1 Tax=unclassified Halorubrum TaxID=2642239 RepID=UPI000B9859DB|nr:MULTISPECIES: DUF4112 domain-containing protein [unclassified Halorubrum]OYR38981.1 hypothetical protein DJ82_11125 [Halorubrum sp. Ib24]OYR42058.1 hypothetical protein DJ75_13205 [Halorubrum sp. Eb13]OYR51051.1 hypothetical protein DJ73_14705 [Halorubrum sp. Ea1]
MPAAFESRFDIDYDGELPENVDEAALKRMETVAYILDESVRVPGIGFRIGIDPVLGALPVAGDLVSAAFSLYIVAESAYLGVSFTTLVEMLTNISIDVVGGSIPYVGTVVDALWKANKRNVALTLEDLAEAVETDGAGGRADGGVDIPVEPDD